MKNLQRLTMVLGLAGALLAPAHAQTAAYPAKAVTMTVGYAPGGATDVIARIVAQALSARWKQQVVVENKSGAGGMIGAERVVRAPADGHVLLLAYTPEVSINKLIYKQMSYDPGTDLTPIALVSSANLFLVSGPKLPVSSVKELLERKGQNVTYGSPGTGGQQHLAGEYFQLQTGMPLTHVPYKGAAPAVTDLVGGQIDIFFSTPPVILPHIKSGRLKPLMVTSMQRDPLMPDVPSAKEMGLQDFEIANWFGLYGPKGMDPALVEKISADMAVVLKDPVVLKRLEDSGLSARYLNPQQLGAFMQAEMKKYGDIITRSNVQKQ